MFEITSCRDAIDKSIAMYIKSTRLSVYCEVMRVE